jgi:hypothetical protein
LDARGWGLDEARKAGRMIASGWGRPRLEPLMVGCPRDELLCVWAAHPPAVVACIEAALEHERIAAERAQAWAAISGGGS